MRKEEYRQHKATMLYVSRRLLEFSSLLCVDSRSSRRLWSSLLSFLRGIRTTGWVLIIVLLFRNTNYVPFVCGAS